jgi:alpha,alpha-trehalase
VYFDYDFVNKKQFPFEASIFSFVGWNVPYQAKSGGSLQFIKAGGITGSTKAV